MIEINLLPGAKRKRGAKGGGFQLPDFKQWSGLAKDPWLIAFVASWVVVVLMLLVLYLPRRARVDELRPQLAAQQREAGRMNRVLALRRQYDARRESLETQIGVIRDIDRQRYIWPHILQAVTVALPDYTWLDELTAKAGGQTADSASGAATAFQLTGKSADIQAVTRFVRNLEDSPFVQNVATVSTGTVTEQGKDVYTFTVTAQYQEPDSAQITTEPLAATLVQGVRSGGGGTGRH